MIKLTFKGLYNITKELAHKAKEPFVNNKNKRAFASAIDSVEMQKIEAEEKIEKELSVVAEGKVIDINKVLELRQIISSADETILELEKFKTEFFEE